jgi:hypothetical protein
MAPTLSSLLLAAFKSRSTVALTLGGKLLEQGGNGLKSVLAADDDLRMV